jgi:hypothetical protein
MPGGKQSCMAPCLTRARTRSSQRSTARNRCGGKSVTRRRKMLSLGTWLPRPGGFREQPTKVLMNYGLSGLFSFVTYRFAHQLRVESGHFARDDEGLDARQAPEFSRLICTFVRVLRNGTLQAILRQGSRGVAGSNRGVSPAEIALILGFLRRGFDPPSAGEEAKRPRCRRTKSRRVVGEVELVWCFPTRHLIRSSKTMRSMVPLTNVVWGPLRRRGQGDSPLYRMLRGSDGDDSRIEATYHGCQRQRQRGKLTPIEIRGLHERYRRAGGLRNQVTQTFSSPVAPMRGRPRRRSPRAVYTWRALAVADHAGACRPRR